MIFTSFSFKKIRWAHWFSLLCILCLAIIIIGETKRRGERETEFIHCTHQNVEKIKDIINEIYLDKWKCDYCDKIISLKGVHCTQTQVDMHLNKCEKAQEIIRNINSKKDNSLVYDDENSLEDKGYTVGAIKQIKDWGLIDKVNLQNLKEEKRIGVVNSLLVTENSANRVLSSESFDSVIFLTPSAVRTTLQNFTQLLKRDKKPDFFYNFVGKKGTKAYERSIMLFFIWRILSKGRSWNFNVNLLKVDKYHYFVKNSPLGGGSDRVSSYLSLLSAYYQKPISREVATTACIEIGNYSKFDVYCPWCLNDMLENNPEEVFSKHKISPVGSLEHKIKAAVKAGVKKLILSAEQQKDYEKNIPQEIKEKLKIYYVKNVEELEKLFWAGEFS